MLVLCLKWHVLKTCCALEDSHCVLLSAAEVPVACGHVSGAEAGWGTALQHVPCPLRDRCSWCLVLVGQDVIWEQGTAPRPGKNSGAGATCVEFILAVNKDSWVQLIAGA